MLDDKLAKSIMNIDSLRPLLDELELTSRAVRPLMEQMRALERSDLQQAVQIIEDRDVMVRAAMKPISDSQEIAALMARSPLLEEMRASSVLASLETHFRLPDLSEIGRLVADFQTSPLAETLATFAQQPSSLQKALEQMATPWLRAQEPMRSVVALAELHGIGHAISSIASFDDKLAAVLRVDLGDWRDPITWRADVLSDLNLRASFYADLGFNRELTAFPAEAFAESLDVSRLRSEPPPLVLRYGAPVARSDDDEQEEGFARTNKAHDWLQRLETQLRAFIDEQLTRAFGVNWPRHRLPNGLYDQWREKKRKAQETGAADWPLIAYADFTDYALVICRSDNWRDVFAAYFRRQESLRESFQRLHPIRLDTMHARPISQDDELLLYVETRRLMRMFRGD